MAVAVVMVRRRCMVVVGGFVGWSDKGRYRFSV
jgi:hypothetical protein